ncbi:efflux RND transporter periplasmic adaptor subunit, partial [Achromobacter xylosoxidans]|nr:efflux RND transporter periplasmic adaptor subunit [Achromobacter xylosoxidans]MCH1999895.1 efflux RND transporter periplasmic adaptor subunit [Achromobacter xylosoxidans]
GPARLETAAQFPGEIKFNADRTAHVVPRLAGVVQEVSADLGQQVRKGDLLAALSSTALSELRSEWLAASKRRDLAAATHQRELKLWREKVSAEQDYQQARTALQEAQIAVQNAAQKLAAIGAPPQSKDLSRLEIRAPFDGVVVEKHIALGEALADTASIFTLSDLRTVW